MRHLIGAGTPKEAAARSRALLFVVYRDNTLAIVIFTAADTDYAILIVAGHRHADMITTDTSSTG